MDNTDDWHRPKMSSLRYFHSNWAKIANMNLDKLKRTNEYKEESNSRLERARALLSK